MRSEFLGNVLVGDVVRNKFREFGNFEALCLNSEK